MPSLSFFGSETLIVRTCDETRCDSRWRSRFEARAPSCRGGRGRDARAPRCAQRRARESSRGARVAGPAPTRAPRLATDAENCFEMTGRRLRACSGPREIPEFIITDSVRRRVAAADDRRRLLRERLCARLSVDAIGRRCGPELRLGVRATSSGKSAALASRSSELC